MLSLLLICIASLFVNCDAFQHCQLQHRNVIQWKIYKNCYVNNNFYELPQHSLLYSHNDNYPFVKVIYRPFQVIKNSINKFKTFAFALLLAAFTASPVFAKRDDKYYSSSSSTVTKNKQRTKSKSAKLKASNTITKSSTSKAPIAVKTNKKKEVEIVLKKSKNQQPVSLQLTSDSNFMTKERLDLIGYAALGISLIYTITKKENVPLRKSTKTIEPIISDDNRSGKISSRHANELKKFTTLQPVEELFEEPVDSIIDKSIEEDKMMKEKQSKIAAASERQQRFEDLDFVPTETQVSVPPPVPKPQEKKSGGFFANIFKKAGGDRPLDLESALRTNDPSYGFKVTVVGNLMNYLPNNLIPAWKRYASDSTASTEEDQMQIVSASMEECALSVQDAANAFADIANAMLATLVDRAIITVDDNDKDDATLEAIDAIGDFVNGAGSLFSKCLSSAAIDPVIYNGKAKKSKVENLYYKYLKSTMSIANLLKSIPGVNGDNEEDNTPNEESIISEKRLEKIGLIQQVLGIKENKRSSIEQRVMREAFMNMASGSQDGSNDGILGNLKGLFDSQGKDMNDFKKMIEENQLDPESNEELMKKLGLDDVTPAAIFQDVS